MSSNQMRAIIISDGTGETAISIAKAAITQFKDKDIIFTRYKNVRTDEAIENILTEAEIHHDIVLYTIVSTKLRILIDKISYEKNILTIDLMGPVLTKFSNWFDQTPISKPGLLHRVNPDYFKKIDAIEFSLNHDNGKNLKNLESSDIILVGISRTSKTPLAFYLSLHGFKVSNIPIIKNKKLPAELKQINPKKVFALLIDENISYEIRNKKSNEKNTILEVKEEIEWANNIYNNNRWLKIDITNKALEDTASEIMKIITMRENNMKKQIRNTKED